jgi:peptidoglycan/LPS O-acetylase OafA/YrhL
MIAVPDNSFLQNQTNIVKLETLQIARGLAALFVVCRHITGSNLFYLDYNLLGGVFRPGWNSIDFFFTLSGFLFGSIHSKDVGNKGKLSSFLIKRFIRIYPAYWIAAVVSMVYFLIYATENLSLEHVLKSFLLIPQKNVPVLGVAWSLCYEIVFYLIFALYIYGGKKVMKAGFLIHLALIFILYLAPDILNGSFILSFIANPYYLEFIAGFVGGLICFTLEKGRLEKCRLPLLIIGIITFSLVKFYSLNDFVYSNDFFLTRIGFAISISLIIVALSQYSVNTDNLFVKPFILLGNASFALYLWHPILLALFFKGFSILENINQFQSGALTNYTVSSIVLLLSIGLAIFIYRSIEQPLLAYLKKTFL